MGAIVSGDTTKLSTPVGSFIVVSDSGEPIMFSVVQDERSYGVVIDSRKLEIGKIYKIFFTFGNWKFCDLNEHTTCYNTVINDWVVGIGAYDPNDEEKLEQAIEYSKQKGYLEQKFIVYPSKYDEVKFSKYTVDVLEECNGYSFRVFDYSFDNIRFEVAWIQVGELDVDECEEMLGVWLC